MKNILLVSPNSTTYNMSSIGEIFNKPGETLPITLLSIASALGDTFNYKMIDEDITPLTKVEIAWADFFIIYADEKRIPSTLQILKHIDSKKNNIIIISPDTRLRVQIPLSITFITGDLSDNDISGINLADCLKKDLQANKLKSNYTSSILSNKFITPNYNLTNFNQYRVLSISIYKNTIHVNNKYRVFRSSDSLAEELTLLLKYNKGGGKTIYIEGKDIFKNAAQNFNNLHSITESIYKWQSNNDYPFDFCFNTTLPTEKISSYKKLLLLMIKSGVNIMYLNIYCSEKITITEYQRYIEDIKFLQKLGMGIFLNLHITPKLLNTSNLKCIQELIMKSNVPVISITNSSEDLKKSDETYNRTNTQAVLNQSDELLTLIKNIYSPEQYFKRTYQWILDWNDANVINGEKGSILPNLTPYRIIKSLVLQGIHSNYRFPFVSFLVKSLFRHSFNINKLGLSFFLAYFYNVIHKNSHLIERRLTSIQ